MTKHNGETFKKVVEESGVDPSGWPNGPKDRYVEDPLHKGKYIDMRHMLVIGPRLGNVGGGFLEIVQFFVKAWRNSAMNPQDVYSNELGARFWAIYGVEIALHPDQFISYLNEFLHSSTLRQSKSDARDSIDD